MGCKMLVVKTVAEGAVCTKIVVAADLTVDPRVRGGDRLTAGIAIKIHCWRRLIAVHHICRNLRLLMAVETRWLSRLIGCMDFKVPEIRLCGIWFPSASNIGCLVKPLGRRTCLGRT
jgi:hypothetical protein